MLFESQDILFDLDQEISGYTQERRKHGRRQCRANGQIYINGAELISCAVQDISLSGAKLILPQNTQLPQKFEIMGLFEDRLMDVSEIWRKDQEVGVRFWNTWNVIEWQETEFSFFANRHKASRN